MNTSADQYFIDGCGRCEFYATPQCKVHSWTPELQLLREILGGTDLTEDCKWGVPCYTYEGKNILMLSAFRDYCSLSFFKGALLADQKRLLVKPGPNSQASRQFRFTELSQVEKVKAEIASYILEAVNLEKEGKTISFKKNPEPIPEELSDKFEEDPMFKNAFESLTPGRQRGYILYFSQPKQSKTRISRIEKCSTKILKGEGLHDKYQSKKTRP